LSSSPRRGAAVGTVISRAQVKTSLSREIEISYISEISQFLIMV
jgi:hypothetical protein